MKEIEIIISLIGTCLGLFITLLTYFLKFTKNQKIRKQAESILELTNKLLPYIKEAEEFQNYSGQEKREYVLTKANRYAIENKVPYNELEVIKKVEELVSLTKEVNKKTIKIWEGEWNGKGKEEL